MIFERGQRVKVVKIDNAYTSDRYKKYLNQSGIIEKNTNLNVVDVKFDCDGLREFFFSHELELDYLEKTPEDWL